MALFECYERRIAPDRPRCWPSTASPPSKTRRSSPMPRASTSTRSSRSIQPIAFENACWAYICRRGHRPQEGPDRRPWTSPLRWARACRPSAFPARSPTTARSASATATWPSMLLQGRDQVLRLPGRPRVLRRRRRRHRPRPLRQQGPQAAAARDPERPRQGRGPDHLAASTASPTCRPKFDYATSKLNIVREIAYSKGEKAKVRCYGADDVREGVAINHHEGVDVSITGNSTNPTRFQHPVAGTYKKECLEQGKKYFSVASAAAAPAAPCTPTTWPPVPPATA